MNNLLIQNTIKNQDGKNHMIRHERKSRFSFGVIILVFCQIIGFFSVTGNAEEIEGPTDFSWSDPIANSDNLRKNREFGTQISSIDGSVNWNHTDFHLPQNGPDIRIGRSLTSSQAVENGMLPNPVYTPTEVFDWSLDIPKIHFNYWGEPGSALSSCNHSNIKTLQATVYDIGGFDPIGMDTQNINYPTGTAVHFANNWLLVCGSYTTRSDSVNNDGLPLSKTITSGIKLKSPDGTTYYLSLDLTAVSNFWHTFTSLPESWHVNMIRTSYVTDIEDKHGNWLAFDYKENIKSLNTDGTLRKSELLLTSVRSKEGTTVTLSNDGNNITGITHADVSITFTPEDKVYSFPPYNVTVLSEMSRLNGSESETWTYVHSEFGEPTELGTYPLRGLTKIRNPWGGIADFKYALKLFGCSRNSADWPDYSYYLSEMTTSGVGLSTHTVNYKVKRNATDEPVLTPLSDFAYTTITYPDRKEIHKYHCKEFETRTYGAPKYYRDTPDIRDHRYKSIEIFDNADALIRKTEHEWQEQIYQYGSEDDLWHDPNGPNRLVLKKVTIDGEYETSYSNLDIFGEPLLVKETHIPNSRTRYHKSTLFNDQANWLIGLPKTVNLSSNNSVFTEVSAITYHTNTLGNPSYKDRGLPYESKSFGAWKRRNVSYHADGNINKVEMNRLLKNSVGTVTNKYQYITLSNYKRGQAQLLTLPARYSDTGSMSSSRLIDNNGWVTQSTDLNGNTVNYDYNGLGQLKYIDPIDSKWADTLIDWSNISSGQEVKAIQRCTLNGAKTGCNGGTLTRSTSITFDGLLRTLLISEKDEITNTTVHKNSQFNAYHQLTFESLWSNTATETRGTTFEYDQLRRSKSKSVSNGGIENTYYLSNNRVRVNDARGHDTTTTYLAYGQPQYQSAIRIESPESVVTELDIDLFGNVNSVTQSGPNKANNGTISQTETRYYDGQKNLCLVKRNDVGDTAYLRNVLGDIEYEFRGNHSGTACLTSGSTSMPHFIYDNQGQLYQKDFRGQAPNVGYQFDNAGNLKKLTAGQVIQIYNYNSQNLLDDETLALDGKILTLDYDYDANGSLSGLTYPDGDTVTYAPNAFNQPTKALRSRGNYTYVSNATYYPNGSIDTFTFGNGLVHKTTLNNRDLPDRITDSIGTIKALDFSYTYDNNINITRLTNNVNTSYSLTNLTYDDLDRLIDTTGNSGIGSSSLSYDGLGNITSYISKNSNLDYFYDTTLNRLNSVTGTGSASKNYNFSNGYDAKGNVTNNGTRGFVYNLANQMVGSETNAYVYDGYNRRVKQSDASGTSYSMYSQAGRLLYRESKVNTSTNIGDAVNYIFLGNKLVAKDGVIESSESSRSHYKPFGESLEAPKDGVGYTGHKFDTDIGLSYMQARYYDPAIGRFYSNDPVGFRDIHSFNRYTYANNNPYKYKDPNGETATLAMCFGGPLGCAIGVGATLLAVNHGIQNSKPKRDPEFGGKVRDKNREKNGGDLFCEGCGQRVEDGKKREKGVPVPDEEGQADHTIPLSDGGADDAETNGQVLCANPCHRDKTREENKERAREKRENKTKSERQWQDRLRERSRR